MWLYWFCQAIDAVRLYFPNRGYINTIETDYFYALGQSWCNDDILTQWLLLISMQWGYIDGMRPDNAIEAVWCSGSKLRPVFRFPFCSCVMIPSLIILTLSIQLVGIDSMTRSKWLSIRTFNYQPSRKQPLDYFQICDDLCRIQNLIQSQNLGIRRYLLEMVGHDKKVYMKGMRGFAYIWSWFRYETT